MDVFELQEKKRDFCLGYKHLDLSNTNIKTLRSIGEHDISYDDKKMFELSKQLRYQVTDTSCTVRCLLRMIFLFNRLPWMCWEMKKWGCVVNLNTR